LFWAGSTLSLAGEFVQESGTNVKHSQQNIFPKHLSGRF